MAKIKDVSVQSVMEALNKEYGEGTIVRANDQRWVKPVSRITSGSLALDAALGGGFPRGRMTQIYGRESSAKSSIAYSTIREVQRRKGKALIIVLEADFDPSWVEQHGVKVDDSLMLSYPETLNAASDTCEMMTRTDEFDVIVFDSIAASASLFELERSAAQDSRGGHARLINSMLQKVTSAFNARTRGRPNQTAVLLINQLRTGIGGYVPFDTRYGGRGLDYFPSIHVRLGWTKSEETFVEDDVFASLDPNDKGKIPVARDIKFLVEKNKTFRPMLPGMFRFRYKREGALPIGIDVAEEALRMGAVVGLVRRGGPWVTFPDGTRVQGEERAVLWLYEHPAELQKLREEALAKFVATGGACLVGPDDSDGAEAAPDAAPDAAPEASSSEPAPEPRRPLPTAPAPASAAGDAIARGLASGVIQRNGPAWFTIVASGRKVRKTEAITYIEAMPNEQHGSRASDTTVRADAGEPAQEPKKRGRPRKGAGR